MAIVHLDTGGEGGSADEASEVAFVHALRTRSADALEAAYGFLGREADAWTRLRADVLLGARPVAELESALASEQASDGSLPPLGLVAGGGLGFPISDPARLDAASQRMLGTLEAMLIAGDAKGLLADWVESAAHFFEGVQGADGGFRLAETDAGRDGAGPALEAGVADPEPSVFWTGMIAGILGRTPVARNSLLEGAGHFLGERFTPEAVEHDGYPALLAYAHFFTNVAHEDADGALQWCGRALEKGFRSRALDGVATVRVLLTCDAQAMPGATFDTVELLERVLEEQAGDGGFAELAVGGPSVRTTQTFDAMLAIVRLCAALDHSD